MPGRNGIRPVHTWSNVDDRAVLVVDVLRTIIVDVVVALQIRVNVPDVLVITRPGEGNSRGSAGEKPGVLGADSFPLT